MVLDHIAKLADVAKQQQAILMFRPVNLYSSSLLKKHTAGKGMQGCAAGKAMYVKNKTSDWAPWRAMYPTTPGSVNQFPQWHRGRMVG
ncbi:MAG: hypothetical protein HC848_00795 [Limnobacter sp.]|nr:hypothetical protein [Limnobacter sp.]